MIVKYQFHTSILITKIKIGSSTSFACKRVMLSDIKNEIKGLNPNKETIHKNIPPKMLWQSTEVTANILQLLFNNAISNSEFPENLKLANVAPVFKEIDPLGKKIDADCWKAPPCLTSLALIGKHIFHIRFEILKRSPVALTL